LQELEGDQWSTLKKRGHLDAVRQEVDTLRKLRGSLNVASLEDVYEDQTHVHIITELCAGGELVHRIGNKHYSERTVSWPSSFTHHRRSSLPSVYLKPGRVRWRHGAGISTCSRAGVVTMVGNMDSSAQASY